MWNNLIYLDNNNIVGALNVGSINLNLLFDEEQIIKVNELKKVLNSLECQYKIFSIDKPINLDNNLAILNNKITNSQNPKKVKVLENDYSFINDLNKNKMVYNREFYICLEDTKDNENILNRRLNDLKINFNNIGLTTKRVSTEELKDLLFLILNPTSSLDVFRSDNINITRPFKEKIAPKGIKICDKHVILGDAYVSVITLLTYPSVVGVGWLGSVANVPNTRLTINVSPTNSIEISNTLKKSMSEVKSKLINTNDYNEQILLNNKLEDYTELVNRIDREHERFGLMTVNFLCYSENLDELDHVKKELSNILTSYGLGGSALMFEQERSLKMCFPTSYHELENQFGLPLPLLTLSSAFPFIFHNLQDEGDAIALGSDALGGLVLFDLWKRTDKRRNSNAVIIGKSGSGKSTTSKLLIKGNWARGKKVIIIDPEREYKDLCQKCGGLWIDCGSGSQGIINPLEVRATTTGDDEDDTVQVISLSKHFQTFRTFIKYYLQDLTAFELTKLEEILIEVYSDKGIDFDTDLTNYKSEDYPIMQDLYNKVCVHLQEEKQKVKSSKMIDVLEKISSLLKRATFGADAKLFNGTSSIKIDKDSDFIVLDINSLVDADDCILKTQFFNILSWTWNEISKNRDEEIILVIDEAYILIDKKNKDGIDFVKNTSKRIRKYNGSMIIISQNLIDFLDEEIARYGQVIIDNSTYIFTMAQGNKEITAVKDLLNLSQSEVSFLTTASKGQCLLSISQDTKIPIQVYISEFDKALFGKGGGR